MEVLVRLPGEENVAAIARLLDLAFDPNTSAWLLGSDGSGTATTASYTSRRP